MITEFAFAVTHTHTHTHTHTQAAPAPTILAFLSDLVEWLHFQTSCSSSKAQEETESTQAIVEAMASVGQELLAFSLANGVEELAGEHGSFLLFCFYFLEDINVAWCSPGSWALAQVCQYFQL